MRRVPFYRLAALAVVSLFALRVLRSVFSDGDDAVARAAARMKQQVPCNGPLFEPTPNCTGFSRLACCPIEATLHKFDVISKLCLIDGPGGCNGREPCQWTTCLNRLPLPCFLRYPDSARTSYTIHPVHKAVLTLAAGPDYDLEWGSVFLGSLRRTAYDGLIVVFVDQTPSPAMSALLKALDVEIYIFDRNGYPTNRLTAIRFLVYQEFLEKHRDRLKGAKIFHCDSRDIVFQADPFDFQWPTTVSGFPSSQGGRRFGELGVRPYIGAFDAVFHAKTALHPCISSKFADLWGYRSGGATSVGERLRIPAVRGI